MKIKGLSDDESLKLRATLGLHRKSRHLTPIETAKLIIKATNSGESLDSLSNKVNTSSSQLDQIRKLNKIPNQKIVDTIVWGQANGNEISMTSAKELVRLSNPNDILLVYKNILKHKFNKNETKEIISLFKRSSLKLSESIEQILNARPKIKETVLLLGNIKSDLLINKLKEMTPFERNKLIKSIIDTNFSELNIKGHKLKIKQFIIIGNDETQKYFESLDIPYDHYIENLLLKVLE